MKRFKRLLALTLFLLLVYLVNRYIFNQNMSFFETITTGLLFLLKSAGVVLAFASIAYCLVRFIIWRQKHANDKLRAQISRQRSSSWFDAPYSVNNQLKKHRFLWFRW